MNLLRVSLPTKTAKFLFRISRPSYAMTPSAAETMLILLRAGVPNLEVLRAKTVEDLVAIAEQHHITLPSFGSDRSDMTDEASVDGSPANATGGDMDDGLVSGRGGHYEGERNARGEWEGFGRYTFTDGSVYEGQWRANRQDGLGTFWYASGNEYYGQWKAGKKHGKGTFGYADGRVEVGTYVADRDEGEGAMWSGDRRVAWRIVQDGLEVAEITLEEARAIAARIGEPVPAKGKWLEARLLAAAAEKALALETKRAVFEAAAAAAIRVMTQRDSARRRASDVDDP